jgi:hypothetical protein
MTVVNSTEHLQPPILVIGVPVKGCDSLLRLLQELRGAPARMSQGHLLHESECGFSKIALLNPPYSDAVASNI